MKNYLSKKYIIPATILALLLIPVSVSADTVSLIGKKIQGQVEVFLDGNKVENAIIVNGTSYIPVRSVGESLGLDVSFKEGGVILKTNISVADSDLNTVTEDVTIDEIHDQNTTPDDRLRLAELNRAKVLTKIKTEEKKLEGLMNELEMTNKRAVSAENKINSSLEILGKWERIMNDEDLSIQLKLEYKDKISKGEEEHAVLLDESQNWNREVKKLQEAISSKEKEIKDLKDSLISQ